MHNLKLSIEGNTLTITIDLAATGYPSKSGRSEVLASTGGNLRLFDRQGYRPERLNLSLTKTAPKQDRY